MLKTLLHFMIKNLLCFSLLLILQQSLKAQEHFITYNNEPEKALLNNSQSPSDYLKLALVAELNEAEATKILARTDDHIKQLNWEASADQKTEKRLKQLFQMVHATFLKKYEEKAVFSQLFNTGEYQCVGASILYAYILEYYKIPYQIKETPTHVYVVAYPGSYNILFETTDPTTGYFVPDVKSKTNYVNALVKEKYLDAAYVEKVGVDQAFNEVFYSKTSITLKNSVGLLYYNKALEELNAVKYNEAYSDMAKAAILYPATKHEFLKSEIMGQLAKNFKFEGIKDWEALAYITNGANADENDKKNVEYEFNELIQSKLWKNGQQEKIDEIYAYLNKNLKDSTLKSNIEDNYLSENARYNFAMHKYPEAQTYIEKEIVKNPKNPMPKLMLVDIIAPRFSTQNGSVQNIDQLNQVTTRFPFLVTDPTIRSIYLFNYAAVSYYAFMQNDGPTGDKYMKMMMNELDTYTNHTQKNDMQVALVFAKASEYHYRKQGKQKAMEILNSGLKYEPDNQELLRKIRVFKESKL